MSKYDAERALNIYKIFSKQTNLVVDYLSTARSYENATRLEIPKLKHAPTSLTGALEEYLNDPDFEINRRQYLAQQKSQKGGQKNLSNGNGESSKAQPSRSQPQVDANQQSNAPLAAPPTPAKPEPTGPAPDLIDLFDSIEQKQQPMANQTQSQISGYQLGPQYYQTPEQQQQQAGFPPQPQNFFTTNGTAEQQVANALGNMKSSPFTQSNLQTQAPGQPIPGSIFSGTSLGNYPQSLYTSMQASYSSPVSNSYSDYSRPQTSSGSNQQTQSTNPFRQSVLPQHSVPLPSATNVPPLPSQPYHSTNPFAKPLTPQPTASIQQPFTSAPSQPQSSALASPPQSNQFSPFQPLQSLQSLQPVQSPQSLQPPQPLQTPQPLQANLTGTNPFARAVTPSNTISSSPTASTNPFRQTPFAAQQTWQANQGTIGGLEQLETVPVFPRPGQQGPQGPQGPGLGWP